MNYATLVRCSALVLALSACGDRGAETQPAAEAGTEAPATTTTATAEAGTAPLSVYVGRHPSEEVDGRRFLDEPAVQQAVAGNVPDEAIRQFVFNYDGPDAPITERDGRLVAWGCKRHECGYQNWSVVIAPDGTNAEVCFYENPDDPEGTATWYLAEGRTEQRPGNCSSE